MSIISTYSVGELVRLLNQKDEQSFTYLYDNYSGTLYGIVLDILPDRELASEVLQEVFVKIWKKIRSYDPSKGTLFTWMLNIARHSAIDTLRSEYYQNRLKTESISDAVYFNSDLETTYLNLNNIGIKKLVAMLKPDHRNLIDLAYLRGHTHSEIAKMLNMPLGTVKTRITNALLQLRIYFNTQDPFFRQMM